jgi:prepilin-type N-terminal cleavage/methylation domain-containing protein
MNHRTRSQHLPRAFAPHALGPRAFTLVELITVIAVMAVLITIGVPAFRAALESSNKALSESQFRIGMELARQVAIQNSSRDAAAVFMFEPFAAGGPRMSIVPCIYVGTMLDKSGAAANAPLVERDIFVPVPEMAPVQLPRSWMVRGFAPPGSIDDTTQAFPNGWYERDTDRDLEGLTTPVGNWVFPENAFYKNISITGVGDPSLATEGPHRQSFMVRFKAGSGSVDPSVSRLCLVIDPAPSQTTNANGQLQTWRNLDALFLLYPIDMASDLQRYVKRLLATEDINQDGSVDPTDSDARQLLIGGKSSDTVLCRPVTELSLYREKSLASALGASGGNQVTGTIYGDGSPQVPIKPQIDIGLFPTGASTATIARDTNLWLTGRLKVGTEFVESDAKLFAMDRYLGQGRKLGDEREVTP